MKKTQKIISTIIFIIILLMIKLNETNASTTGTINEITVKLREKPSTSSNMLTFVTQDDIVEVIEKDGDWYKVKYKDYTGYVFGKYVKVKDEAKLENNNSSDNQTSDEEKNEESDNKDSNTTSNEDANKSENENNDEQLDNNDTETKEVSSSTQLVKEYKIPKSTKVSIIPNINASIIYTANDETKIEIIQMLNKWSYINIQGIKGWVRNDLIKEEDVIDSSNEENINNSDNKDENTQNEQTEKVAYIKYDTVNLREKPSTSSKVVSKLKLNTEVKIKKDYDDSWYEVEVDGDTGYVSKDLVSDTKQKEDNNNTQTTSRGSDISRVEEENTDDSNVKETEKIEAETKKEDTDNTVKEEEKKDVSTSNTNRTNNSRVTGDDIVEYAKKFLGCKYKYGGTSPSGFDCSGLTYYVYNHFGYKLNRSSAAQAKNGKYVEKSDLQKGDLVLFRKLGTTGNTIGHVGIYIGDNKFIEASDYSTGVIISSLSQKNYASRYITARRILNN